MVRRVTLKALPEKVMQIATVESAVTSTNHVAAALQDSIEQNGDARFINERIEAGRVGPL